MNEVLREGKTPVIDNHMDYVGMKAGLDVSGNDTESPGCNELSCKRWKGEYGGEKYTIVGLCSQGIGMPE